MGMKLLKLVSMLGNHGPLIPTPVAVVALCVPHEVEDGGDCIILLWRNSQARIDNPNFANAVRSLTQYFANVDLSGHEASAIAYANIYHSLQAQSVPTTIVEDQEEPAYPLFYRLQARK